MVFLKIPLDIQEKAKIYGDAVFELKKNYSSSRYLNPDSHAHAKWGEWLFAQKVGLVDKIDWSVTPEGDQYDFLIANKTIDVKTTTYWRYPELKCFASENKSDYLVLASISPAEARGRLVGYTTRENLFQDKNYQNYRGLGFRYVLKEIDLCKDWRIFYGKESNNRV